MAKPKKQKVELEINTQENIPTTSVNITQSEIETFTSKSEELVIEATPEKVEVAVEELPVSEEIIPKIEEVEKIEIDTKEIEFVQQQTGKKIGKINVTKSFLDSNTIFFTCLHKQGYVIIDRKFHDREQTMDFILEGGELLSITDGSIPEYNVRFSRDRISITKK